MLAYDQACKAILHPISYLLFRRLKLKASPSASRIQRFEHEVVEWSFLRPEQPELATYYISPNLQNLHPNTSISTILVLARPFKSTTMRLLRCVLDESNDSIHISFEEPTPNCPYAILSHRVRKFSKPFFLLWTDFDS
jgi:hypothetical protein